MKIFFNATTTVAVLLLLAACASHPPRVDCEKHLKPINAPAPVARAGGVP